MATYPTVDPQPKLPHLELEILRSWEEAGTFQASVAARAAGEDGANEYVFYDGPPFANGLPHYGHLLTGYVKDAVPRYQTMRGRRVERRFGWDCHGLPAEVEAEKELGISGHPEITASASTSSMTRAVPVCCATPANGSVMSVGRLAGLTSPTTTRRSI